MTTVLLLSRRIQPAAFALALSCFAVGLTWISLERVDGPWEQILGVSGIGLSVWLTISWVINSNRMLRWGMLAALVLWVYVAWIALTAIHALTANWLSAIAWASLAGGSYFMEQKDYSRAKERRER